MSLDYESLPAEALDADLLACWQRLRACAGDLDSPYFHAGFCQAVAAVRGDARVTLLLQDGEPCGMFPFHRDRLGRGRPIGLALCDYHGLIAPAELDWSPESLLRASGLVRYDFDHWRVRHGCSEPVLEGSEPSPIIDLAGGFEAYLADRRAAGSNLPAQAARKARRLADAYGPLTLVDETAAADALERVIALKSAQCRATGTLDYFKFDWCRALVQQLLAARTDEFGGRIFSLYAGSERVALHYLLTDQGVWHSWLPVYEHRYATHSPGIVLLMRLVEHAAGLGVRYIDLGKDLSVYKQRFMNGAISVGQGVLVRPALLNTLRERRERLEARLRGSTWSRLIRGPGRWLKRHEHRRRYG